MSLRKPSAIQTAIPPVQQGTKDDDMVAAVNDRLRRIVTAIAEQTPATVASSGGDTWVVVVPSGTQDGVNRVFTIPDTPKADSLFLENNGVEQYSSASGLPYPNYTLSGSTITYVKAPKGDNILARYRI